MITCTGTNSRPHRVPVSPMNPFHSKHNRASDNNVDFLRVVLAACVVFCHSFAVLYARGEDDPLYRVSGAQMNIGHVAVNCFFTLSGFLIAQSWLRSPHLGAYFKKRFLRIYPAFVAAMFFCAVVVVPLATGSIRSVFVPRQLAKTALQSAILHPFGSITPIFESNPVSQTVNISLWTIRHEFWCYVILAAVGAAGLLRRLPVLIMFFLSFVCYQAFEHGHSVSWPMPFTYAWGYLESWPRFLTYFLAGTIFFLYRDAVPFSNLLGILGVLLLVAGCKIPHALSVVMPLAATYVIFLFAFHPRLPFHSFARYGDFSYGLYLYAFPIQQMIVQWAGARIGVWTHFALAMCATFPFAFLSWHLVEKRFLRLKPRDRSPASEIGRGPAKMTRGTC